MPKNVSARISAVVGMIGKCKTLADVGCDHAYAAIRAVEDNIAERAFASDIKEGPIKNAENEISKAGLSDRITTILCDGLEKVPPCDCVVIAGMGGETIVDIISRAEWTKKDCTLVLQPMTRPEILREYLYENSFETEREIFVRDAGKLYCIMRVRGGKRCRFEPFEKYISRAALSEALAEEYADCVIKRLEYEYESRKKSSAVSEEELGRREKDIKSLREMREKTWRR